MFPIRLVSWQCVCHITNILTLMQAWIRCGYKLSQLFFHECSNIFRVRLPFLADPLLLITSFKYPINISGQFPRRCLLGWWSELLDGEPVCFMLYPQFSKSFWLIPQGSDFMGRSAAFNCTLFFTAVFGLLASFSNSFTTICVTLFLLGSSVGVSSVF